MPTNLKPNRRRRGRSLSRRSHHVMELLRSLANEDEHAVVTVTHDHRATRFADRLLVLQDGQIMHDQDILGLADRTLSGRFGVGG
jgi:ABC-type lipoprotein export system ATPase subunit